MFRVPSKNELQHAAMVGVSWPEHFQRLQEHAWFKENGGDNRNGVAKKRPNSLGLFDAIGNVWEWCDDGDTLFGNAFDTPRDAMKNGPYSTAGERGKRYGTFGLRVAAELR